MSDRDRTEDSFTGRAGQQAFIAQVLLRFGNAAVPVVDVGTDVIVFGDDRPLHARVQVKTGVVNQYTAGSGYSAQFSIPLKQLELDDVPPLFYALITRDKDHHTFPDILIIPRGVLRGYWDGSMQFGTEMKGIAKLHIQFRDRVLCGAVDLTAHRNDWAALPPLAGKSPPGGQAATGTAGGT